MKTINTQPEYAVVEQLLKELGADGAIERFQGACLPACELTQAILHSRGVKARLLECTALVVNSPTNGNSIEFIGFDSLVPLGPHESDTHFIVLVESTVPFIIDPSIGHKMGSNKYVVVAPLCATDPEIISEAAFKGAAVTYRIRKNPRYLALHQKTMLEKLDEEKKIKARVDKTSKLVLWAIGLGLFNAVANSLLVFIKTIVERV